MMGKNYYEELGVARNASKDEIRKAFRNIAMQSHPDRNPNKDDQERFIRASHAYEVLFNEEKRTQYDRDLKVGRVTETAQPDRYQKDVSYGDIYADLFRGGALNGIFDIFQGTIFAEKPKTSVTGEVMLPDNDWGLLSALVQAYRAENDGQWQVATSPRDSRPWMNKTLYQVVRENGRVRVFRSIKDWRREGNRNRVIKINKADIPFDVETEYDSNHFLGEYFLAGKGKNRIYREIRVIPREYGGYLMALKDMAAKLAKEEGSFDPEIIANELTEINDYCSAKPLHCRVEGSPSFLDENDLEWVRATPFNGFYSRYKEAGKLVTQIEGMPPAKEGQQVNRGERK
jgi:curved DNA-binding protein CbpA